MNLKRLSLLTALPLAVVGYAAVPASADIVSPGPGGSVYQGPIKGVRTGAAPTLHGGKHHDHLPDGGYRRTHGRR